MIRSANTIVAIFVTAIFGGASNGMAGAFPDRQELLLTLIGINDEFIPRALERQVIAEGHVYYGAVLDADSVVSPIATAQLIQTLVCGYVSKPSKYFRSAVTLSRMTLAMRALLALQHEDGTIDLMTTNFHSTPDLGFTIFPLALSYSIMLKNRNPDVDQFTGLAKEYLLKAGKALTAGGIHTPNHRWVVCAALSWIHSFFPDQKYRARVEQWLAEGIDIDADGQYNERSTAVYTPVTNRSLLDVAKRMKMDYLYDVVRRNLDLTFYFVHSNGELVTESSNRQDKYLRRNLSGYYLAYNYMALLDGNGRYAGMIDYISQTVPVEHLAYMLPHFIDDPALLRPLPPPQPVPKSYHRYFKHSDMVRIREEKVDISVITRNPTFLTYFKGEAALEAVRLSSAFFGKGQFESGPLEKNGDTYILSSTISAPYYQPVPKEKLPVDGDAWSKVSRTEREQSEVQQLQTKVYVTESRGKVTIKISMEGPENLPVTVELAFRPGGTLTNVIPEQGIDKAFLVRTGDYVTYSKGDDTIKVGPGVRAHNWTQIRGALPKVDADCVYFTNYAPCEFTFTIE